jgi:GT2 family glycosyltransferase
MWRLREMKLGAKYHFIVNPDIYFEGDVVTPMVQYMADDMTIGMMMPQVLNEDGSVSYLSCCRVRFAY